MASVAQQIDFLAESTAGYGVPGARWLVNPRPRHKPGDPALSAYAQQRAHDVEDCIADAVTEFAGSMPFLHIHVIWFAA
jgi:hypothetical protein